MQDVIIIGAGIIGSATARELSKYNLNVLVLEKAAELSEGTTKANSGIVHAGYDCETGSLKAKLNVAGNKMYHQLSKQLGIPFVNNGSMVLSFSKSTDPLLDLLLEKAKANNVPDVSILTRAEALNLEPNLSDEVSKALYAPSGGIVSPYEASIAFAEIAYLNGVSFQFETEATQIQKLDDGCYQVTTNKGTFTAKVIVNAAGLYSDRMNNMVSETKYQITPRKGEYLLCDKSTQGLVTRTIFQLPTALGKGVLVTPTVHNNLLIGPSSSDIEDKEGLSTTAEILAQVVEKAALSIKGLPTNQYITSFAGLRAHILGNEDFIIGEAPDAKGFINAIAIDSPGLSAAPAIGLEIANLAAELLSPEPNATFKDERPAHMEFRNLPIDQQNELIAQNNLYGKIVCRCESITEGEIVDAIKRPLGATTLDGIKRRTRQSMGRCQGGFCGSKTLEILARELGISVYDVTKCGGESKVVYK